MHQDKLDALRKEIDEIDSRLVPLFLQRMHLARKVAEAKRQGNLPVLNAQREQQVADAAMAMATDDLKGETALLMRTVMSLSRGYQQRLLFDGSAPLLPPAARRKTANVLCAYQGVPGAWSEQATARLFPEARRRAMDYFEDVFLAVKAGEADYGIVPIENSKTGAIGETYDLLKKYGCYIVGRTWIDIRQCLLGLPGTKIQQVEEVLSHPEGLRQCRRFLENKGWEQTACRNTALAAKRVAEGGNPNRAAIGSRLAAQLYGLDVLAADIMDTADNSTSFVVIAKTPEYDEGSNLISLTFSVLHRSGALCEALLPFMAENLNLMRIESRPTSADKYRFFVEISGNILHEKVASALRQAAGASEYFEVLGCYRAVENEGIDARPPGEG